MQVVGNQNLVEEVENLKEWGFEEVEVGVVEAVVEVPLPLPWWVLMGQGEEPPWSVCLMMMVVGVVA